MRMLDAAANSVALEGGAHRGCPLVDARAGVGLVFLGTKPKQIEIEEGNWVRGVIRHGVVDRSPAEPAHIQPTTSRAVIEVYQRRSVRWARG